MTQTRTALVLGATGGIGGEVARTLVRRGWRVRALARKAQTTDGLDWIVGDAMDPASVTAAARGADLIVHGVNPPGYRNWRGLALPMLDNTITAARASGARILFPGTVYNYGADAGALVAETAPQRPTTRKGAIRVEMERRLEQAAADHGVRSLVVRAGDFFGPSTRNNWFAQGIVKPGAPLSQLVAPGPLNVGHDWAYLPDLAETMVRLVERETDLAAFETFHFQGHWFETLGEMMDAVRRVSGRPDLPARPLPWPVIYAAAPFVTMLREMLEMRYLWRRPLRLDNTKLVGLLGAEPHTPVDQALHATLAALGCLDARAEAAWSPNPPPFQPA